MKYKPLVVKETLAKDFIRSVHHVWGSAESCSTTRDLPCDKWLSQLLTTKHMPVLPLWEAPQSSSYAIGLFWRPNTWTEHTQHHNFLELSPGWPMKNMSCTQSTHQPRKRRILSDEEWATSLPRSLTRPVSTAPLHLPLPAERLWEHKLTLRCVSYPMMEPLIPKCTNTAQELITRQFHLFASKYHNSIGNASRTTYKPPFPKICTVT